jgi:hypothetical protein
MSVAIGKIRRPIILGHHDADGMVAAALVGHWMRWQNGASTPLFGAVDFDYGPLWPRLMTALARKSIPLDRASDGGVPDCVGIVDFPATWTPPGAALIYADHHESAFRSCGASEAVHQAYLRRTERDGLFYYDPSAGSCVSVLLQNLERDFGYLPDANLADACRLADRIDRASYRSVEEATDHRGSYQAQFSALILGLNRQEAARAARSLSEGASFKEATIGLHPDACSRIMDGLDRSLEHAPALMEGISSAALLVDWSLEPTLPPVRFAEFRDSSVAYAARLEARAGPDGWQIQAVISRSPWAAAPASGMVHPDMSRIAESVGGGGHTYAAGFRVTAHSLIEARARARELLLKIGPFLQPLPADHPMAVQNP